MQVPSMRREGVRAGRLSQSLRQIPADETVDADA